MSFSRPASGRVGRSIGSQFRPLRISKLETILLQHTRRAASSTTQAAAQEGKNAAVRIRNALYGTAFFLFAGIGYYYVTDTRASVHRWVAVPAIRWWYSDAEEAHKAGTGALRALWDSGLHPRERGDVDGKGDLQIEVSPSPRYLVQSNAAIVF
jgi:dihydroorotate dehydrogenase